MLGVGLYRVPQQAHPKSHAIERFGPGIVRRRIVHWETLICPSEVLALARAATPANPHPTVWLSQNRLNLAEASMPVFSSPPLRSYTGKMGDDAVPVS